MRRACGKHEIACPYGAAIVDLVEPTLERHDRAAQEPVVFPHCIVLCPDPIDLPAKKFVDGQFRVLELRQHMKRGIDRLDDADKGSRHPGMTNDGLVVAAVDALSAAPEKLDRRRRVLAERFSLLQDSELIRIERQLRDEELARSRFWLEFAVRLLQRRQERGKRFYEQLGWDRPEIVVGGFDRSDHHANLVWPDR